MPTAPWSRRRVCHTLLARGVALAGLATGCGREPAPLGNGRAWAEPRMGPPPPPELTWAFDRERFGPMPPPGPGDWLDEHSEDGQDVEQFLADEPNRPAPPRDTIVLQPLLPSPTPMLPDAAEQLDYLARFFGVPVRAAAPLQLSDDVLGARTRFGHTQWHASQILDAIEAQLPDDAYCSIAVTTVDLYPEPSWNFVFGLARLHRRVGVFSLARHDAAFFGHAASEAALVRRRGLGVLAHEVAHMFGMQHCVYHRCLLNGSNTQDEADRSPLHLCAVCLRKLHLLVGFDPRARYEALHRFYRDRGLALEAGWIELQLEAAARA